MSNYIHHLLPQVPFSILLALSLKPRHGYEIMQQVDYDSSGKVKLGPGALYGAIKQLRENNLIEEMPFNGSERRRYYRLTKKGWDRLGADMNYYKGVVKLAEQRHAHSQFLGDSQ
jgi:DNA-binding PadR family transcriptional regulator